MFKTISTFLFAGATAFTLVACSDSDKKEETPAKVAVSVENLSFDADGGTQQFTVPLQANGMPCAPNNG